MSTKPVVGVVLSAMLLPMLGQPSAGADVANLKGSAYGAYVKVGLFGGQPNQVGAAPEVVLPAAGGKKTNRLPSLIAQFGPATIFGGQYQEPGRNPSGELSVSTEGKAGPGGFVTSTAWVVNIGPGPLIIDKVSSTCTANEDGISGSTTVTNGVVETSYNAETQEPVTSQNIPAKPAPNTAVEGTIDHVGDRYRVVFNEQIVDGNTLTVRAVHMYLLGNIAVGDMIIGESVCGLSVVAAAPAPPPSPSPPPSPPPPSPSPEPVPTVVPSPTPEPSVSPSPERATTSPSPEPELSTEPTSSESGIGGGALLLGPLALAGALGGAAFMAFRRRSQGLT